MKEEVTSFPGNHEETALEAFCGLLWLHNETSSLSSKGKTKEQDKDVTKRCKLLEVLNNLK